MRMVYHGLYGPLEPGSLLERLAILGHEEVQAEDITRTIFLGQASAGAEGEALQKSYKEYIHHASPRMMEASEERDERLRRILLEETSKGSFYIRPTMMDDRGQTTFRPEKEQEERKRRRGARKKKKSD